MRLQALELAIGLSPPAVRDGFERWQAAEKLRQRA